MEFEHAGEIAALLTAFCWTVTVIAFEIAGKRVGSLVVNLVRLWIGFLFLAGFGLIRDGQALPIDASLHNWGWLSLSGLIGFLIGDLSLFRAFVLIGARLTMLIYATVPLFTTLFGWILLGETLKMLDWVGMILTIFAVGWVIVERKKGVQGELTKPPVQGYLLALIGSMGQALGLIVSKIGMGDYDPFLSTQIRIIAGTIGFMILFTALGWWPRILKAFQDKRAFGFISLGAFFGPFLGVSFSLIAIRYAVSGVAATIMALVPVFVIIPSILVFKEKVSARAVFGAFVAVGGVALLFVS